MFKLEKIAEQIRQKFDIRTAMRDQALTQARQLTRACSLAIRAVHRDDKETMEAQLSEARTLADKLESNFVTAVCIFIDTDADTIRYAGAGHPPIILHRRTEQILNELSDDGMILGPFPEAEFTSTTVNLKSGDRLILYTDGIIETKNVSGSFYGDTAFKTFIETNAKLSPEDFADSMLKHLAGWSGKPLNESFDDDVTLIVVDKS